MTSTSYCELHHNGKARLEKQGYTLNFGMNRQFNMNLNLSAQLLFPKLTEVVCFTIVKLWKIGETHDSMPKMNNPSMPVIAVDKFLTRAEK